ncbi:iron reductase [Lactobacillus sp.]|uniref:iron reductase n=1 Tax=Lactobacillus sp. TaxID=1591 RepID=UPI003F0772F7
MKKHQFASVMTGIVLFLFLPLPLTLLLNRYLVDSLANLLAIDLGIAAYVWWLAIVFLATRPKWLEKRLGLPVMYALHGMLGIAALLAVTVHKLDLSSFHAIIRNTGNFAWGLEIVLILLAVVFLSGWLSNRIVFFDSLKKKLPHQLSLWLHRLNFAVIGLIWLHVQVIPRIRNLPYFTLVFNLYTLFFFSLYAYQKFVADGDPRRQGQLAGSRSLARRVLEITVKLGEDAPKLEADGYYFLSVKAPGFSREKHPFSVFKRGDKQVSFLIHEVGDYTRKLADLPVGSQVNLEGPYGLFDQILRENPDRPLVAYALGTGIAPLIDLAEEYAGKRPVHLIWSRGQEENYLADRFTGLTEKGAKWTSRSTALRMTSLRRS